VPVGCWRQACFLASGLFRVVCSSVHPPPVQRSHPARVPSRTERLSRMVMACLASGHPSDLISHLSSRPPISNPDQLFAHFARPGRFVHFTRELEREVKGMMPKSSTDPIPRHGAHLLVLETICNNGTYCSWGGGM